jgi:hypothetical protein
MEAVASDLVGFGVGHVFDERVVARKLLYLLGVGGGLQPASFGSNAAHLIGLQCSTNPNERSKPLKLRNPGNCGGFCRVGGGTPTLTPRGGMEAAFLSAARRGFRLTFGVKLFRLQTSVVSCT